MSDDQEPTSQDGSGVNQPGADHESTALPPPASDSGPARDEAGPDADGAPSPPATQETPSPPATQETPSPPATQETPSPPATQTTPSMQEAPSPPATQESPAPQEPARPSPTRWLVVLGIVALLGAGAALWRLSTDSNQATTDQASTVGPGESEAVDFADREPANPSEAGVSDGAVTVGVGDWAEAGFVGAIVANVIEELGYQVRPASPMGPDQAYNALANGQLDIWTDAWFPAHEPYLAVDWRDGSTVGDQLETIATTTPSGGVMGIFVTTDWAEANGISTVEDVLSRSDAATLFDLTGDAIPDFYGCNPTWGCAETINAVIRDHGWRISQYAGDYDASVQSAIARADNGEPALVFTWLPSTYGDDLGVDDGRFSLLGVATPTGGEAATPNESDVVTTTPCRADPCVTGFAVDDLGMATTKAFVAEYPDIASVLAAVRISQGDISAALGAVAQGDTLDAQADAWIETHRSEVDDWLAAGA